MRLFINKLIEKSANYFDSKTNTAINSLPNKGSLSLIDIGAAGKIESRWKSFISSIHYVGFEPDERSRNHIMNKENNFLSYKIMPFALSRSNESVSLNLTRKEQCSSLYKPNTNFLKRFPNSDRFNVVDKVNLECVTLDSIGLDIDFIKIDIQGAELDVFKGASESLDKALGIETEIEFLHLYEDQPLFGDISKFLNSKGFEFIDFINLQRWERTKLEDYGYGGQCVFGDALFLKIPESLDFKNIDIKKISSYISLLLIYRKYDLVDKTLEIINNDDRKLFIEFENHFKKIKKKNVNIKRFIKFINKVIQFLGSNLRIHLHE